MRQVEKLKVAQEGKSRGLVTPTYCLWKNSKAKHLCHAGRELRLQKLLQTVCKQASFLRPSNPRDLKGHSWGVLGLQPRHSCGETATRGR
jgi:hypothetical protein